MGDNVLTIISDKFRNEQNGEEVEGLTVIIDGKLKQMFDKIRLEKSYNNNTEILRDAVFHGINKIIEK